ncbi:MAG: hypothetical protein JSV91_05400 [Phycisphaerales bacterium]|nr:MAG: hypothetical protein JSV91_05400 [Phycisphaerales bacterium]
MRLNTEIWTILIVTVVTALIWAWAATETREEKDVYGTVRFTIEDDTTQWLIDPDEHAPSVTLEGSTMAIQRAEQILRAGLDLEIDRRGPGHHTIDLASALQEQELIAETGVTVAATEPAVVSVDLDRIVKVPAARVDPKLPGVQVTGLEIDQTEVMISMPSLLRGLHPGDLVVEAFVDAAQLQGLPPDSEHKLDATVRLPQAGLQNHAAVTVTPPTVEVTFTIVSRTRELALDSVRVQVAGSPENYREYVVELAEQTLRDVTIEADADLIRRIEAQSMYVAAVVHLSLADMEQGLSEKAVTYFLALPAVGSVAAEGELVQFKKQGDVEEPPIIQFTIRRQNPPQS